MNIVTFTVAICLAQVFALSECPGGWELFRGTCYYFHNETNLNFEDAKNYCWSNESSLVHVDDKVENDYLVAKVKNMLPINSWWIGLTDNDVEGVFQWIDDLANMTYQNFNAHQPDDHDSLHDEDCVIIWHAQGWGWNDANCNSKYHFVCELT